MEIKFDTEIRMHREFFMQQEGTIAVLDRLMKERDELFDRKFPKVSDLPHQS